MKKTLHISYRDGQDGTHRVILHNTKEEALARLNRTEEELEEGNIYEDGYYAEAELEFDEHGNLVKQIDIIIGE